MSEDTCCLARARKGSRFVVGDRESKMGRAVPRVIDISWPDSDGEQARVRDVALFGPMPGTSLLELKALTIRDDGKVAVVSYDVTGYSGTQVSTSQTEMWDLGSLDHLTTLAPEAIILHSSGGPVRRMGLTGDGATLVLWDNAEFAHVFKVDGQLQRRLARQNVDYSVDGNWMYVQYGGTLAAYDRTGGQSLVVDDLPHDGLAMKLWGDHLHVLMPDSFLHLGTQGVAHRLSLTERAVGVVTDGEAWIVRTRTGLTLLDPYTPAKIGEVIESEQSRLLVAMDASNQLRPTRVSKTGDGRYTFCGEFRLRSTETKAGDGQAFRETTGVKHGELGCWLLQKSKDGGFISERTLVHVPDIPGDGELLYQVINRPVDLDLVFVLERAKSNGKWLPARFSTYSVLEGRSLTAYSFPKSLTDDFRGIAWSQVGSETLVVVGTFVGDETIRQLAICTFPVNGGDCVQWIPLPSELREARFSTDGHIALTGFDSDGNSVGALVRTSDGRVVWRSKLLAKDVLPRLEPEDSNTWRVADHTEWAALSRMVVLGGDTAMFGQATKQLAADLDEEGVRNLESEVVKTAPQLSRWDVLRARFHEIGGAIRARLRD